MMIRRLKHTAFWLSAQKNKKDSSNHVEKLSCLKVKQCGNVQHLWFWQLWCTAMQSAGICWSFASSKLICPANLPMPGSICLWHVVWFAPVQSANVHRQLDLNGAQGVSVDVNKLVRKSIKTYYDSKMLKQNRFWTKKVFQGLLGHKWYIPSSWRVSKGERRAYRVYISL